MPEIASTAGTDGVGMARARKTYLKSAAASAPRYKHRVDILDTEIDSEMLKLIETKLLTKCP